MLIITKKVLKKYLNKETEAISLSMLGDYRISKGKIIELDIPEYELKGTFLIKSDKHQIDDKKENVDLTIEKTTI